MGTSVGALLELIEEGVTGDHSEFAHLLGQATAEVVTGSATAKQAARIAAELQFSQVMSLADERSSQGMRLAYTVLLGLFQALQIEVSASPEQAGQGSVKERVLFALAESPAGPTEIGKRVGCAAEVASRTLRNLREQKLVQRAETTGAADGRYHIHELAPAGEVLVDRRITGEDSAPLPDDIRPGKVTSGKTHDAVTELQNLVHLARYMTKRDPRRAAGLGPTLERLKDAVDDHVLRAEAVGELCVIARSVKDVYDGDDLKRWFNELLDMSETDPVIAARAYYERARWRMLYESPDGYAAGALKDIARAKQVGETLKGDDKSYRLAWCTYQQSVAELHASRFTAAIELAEESREYFDAIRNPDLESVHGMLASDVVAARAHYRAGNQTEAVRLLKVVASDATSGGFLRQSADAQMWLGRWGVDGGDGAENHVTAAIRSYEVLGNTELMTEAKSVQSALRYFESDLSAPYALVLKSDLARYSTELNGDDEDRRYPRAYYSRVANLWRKVGVISSRLEDHHGEAAQAFRESLINDINAGNSVGQEATILLWLVTHRRNRTISLDELKQLIEPWNIPRVSDEVLIEVASRMSDTDALESLGSLDDMGPRWRTILLS